MTVRIVKSENRQDHDQQNESKDKHRNTKKIQKTKSLVTIFLTKGGVSSGIPEVLGTLSPLKC